MDRPKNSVRAREVRHRRVEKIESGSTICAYHDPCPRPHGIVVQDHPWRSLIVERQLDAGFPAGIAENEPRLVIAECESAVAPPTPLVSVSDGNPSGPRSLRRGDGYRRLPCITRAHHCVE